MATNLARVKLAVKNVERFDGSQDFDAWFRDFIAMLDAFVVEDADRYEALVLVLDSGILTRVMAECKEAKALPKVKEERTVGWLEGELRKRYAFDKTVLKRLQEVMQRRHEREETLEGYVVAKRQLFLNSTVVDCSGR